MRRHVSKTCHAPPSEELSSIQEPPAAPVRCWGRGVDTAIGLRREEARGWGAGKCTQETRVRIYEGHAACAMRSSGNRVQFNQPNNARRDDARQGRVLSGTQRPAPGAQRRWRAACIGDTHIRDDRARRTLGLRSTRRDMCVAYAREMDLQVGQYSMQSVLWQYIRPTACVGRTRNRGHKRTRYVARRARDARPVSDFADLLQAIHARGDVRRALSR